MVAPGAPSSPSASPIGKPSEEQIQKEIDAFFDAGYDWKDAEKLAVIWKMSGVPADVKAEAGRRLLAGQALPFAATVTGGKVTEFVLTVPAAGPSKAQTFTATYDYGNAAPLAPPTAAESAKTPEFVYELLNG